MAEFVQTTRIAWNGDSQELAQWLRQHAGRPLADVRAGTLAVDPAAVVTVEPLPDEKSIPEKCFDNVKGMVETRGGDFAFGWALSHQGPLSVGNRQQVPLYSRWIYHVVWRDTAGALWEVTPQLDAVSRSRIDWRATIFVVDHRPIQEGPNSQRSQHTAVRPEGLLVSELLNQAQRAESEEQRLHWLRMAFAAVEQHGFTPKECRVESIGRQTRNIFLFAE